MNSSLLSQSYNFIQYSIEDGLAQSQVYALEQDSKGYLWMGTQGGGLSRFDGKEFQHFSTKNGLISNSISEIFEDSLGTLWISTQRGICTYDGYQFKDFHPQNNELPKSEKFAYFNKNLLWIASQKGIYEYNFIKDSLYKLNINRLLDKTIIHDFYKEDNRIWIASNQGTYYYDYKKKEFQSLDKKVTEVIAINQDSDGNIWVLSHTQGLKIYDSNSLEEIEQNELPNTINGWAMFKDSDGNFWIGLEENGLLFYDFKLKKWSKISTREGLPNKNIMAFIQDDWGNIWMGTSGGGVIKYLGQFFVHYDEKEGIHGDRIYAITERKNGQIWFSASSGGLAYYDTLGFQKVEIDSGQFNVKCKALLEDKNENLWVGTIGKGLYKCDSFSCNNIKIEEELAFKEVVALVEDNSSIWIATQKGIYRLKTINDSTYNYQVFSRNIGLRSSRITDLKKSDDGKIWFATRIGEVGYLMEINEKNPKIIKKIFYKQEGLSYDVAVRSLAFDDNGYLWIGTASNGILKADIRTDSVYFNPISNINKLHSYNIYSLQFDKNGNLWAGSEKGVDLLHINEVGIVTHIDFYGKNKGFLGIETCQNAVILDQNNHIWFGTMNGLTQHIPSQKQTKILAPKLHYKEISLFYKKIQETAYASFYDQKLGLKQGLSLPHHTNSINFEFKAINLSQPEEIFYRWRLLGIENEWSPTSKKESVDYSNLPPGDYKFEVQALIDEQLTSNILSTPFSIKKPYWEKMWFKIMSLLILFLLIGLIFYNWKKRIEKREKAKREHLEIENKVLQLEQKALQLQMNPHFIFNALNSIQSLVATKDYSVARTQIGNFAQLMRSILSNSRQSNISLDEEINTLDKYLKMEQFCQKTPFNYTINYNNIDIEEIQIPPMLLQPFVENAVIHGIAHLEKEGNIHINFEVKNNLLICTITDNGLGREKANELKQSKKPGHQSVAMEVTQQRLEALREGKKYIPVEIIDLIDANKNPNGTQVIVRLPLIQEF